MKANAIVLILIIGLASCSQQSNQQNIEENQPNEDSIIENTDVAEVEMVNENLAGNHFAILWETEDNLALLEWDKSAMSGARWGGEMVMFFTAGGDAFGHAIGYDMDTYKFLGKYEIQETDGDKKMILSGTLQVRVEGMEEVQENAIAEKELLIVTKDGNNLASGFSLLQGGVAPQVLIMVLSQAEIDQARMAVVDN